jgi:hypothetical protein
LPFLSAFSVPRSKHPRPSDSGHNGICASSPYQLSGFEGPPFSGFEEAGLTGYAIVGGSSISLGKINYLKVRRILGCRTVSLFTGN